MSDTDAGGQQSDGFEVTGRCRACGTMLGAVSEEAWERMMASHVLDNHAEEAPEHRPGRGAGSAWVMTMSNGERSRTSTATRNATSSSVASWAPRVWAYVVDENTEDLLETVEANEELEAEYENLLAGEEHEFGRAVADHYGIPYQFAGDRITLNKKHARRYRRIQEKLGIEPSMKEKLANALLLKGLTGGEDGE